MNVKQLKLLQNVNFNYWFVRQKNVYANMAINKDAFFRIWIAQRLYHVFDELYTYILRALAYKLSEWRM